MLLLGINHFVMPRFYDRIIPEQLPSPRMWTYLSGAAEIVGALGTMHPRTRRPAGWFLIVTLLAIFPANIYMALNAERYDVPGGTATLIARLPLQALFVYWVWLANLAPERKDPNND
jgi:uncharacterized membrane protein